MSPVPLPVGQPAADTRKPIQPPMPGLVAALPAAAGQEARTDETVAGDEAMKRRGVLKAS